MVERVSGKESVSSTWKWERISPEATLHSKMPALIAEERLSESGGVRENFDDEVGRWKNECERLTGLVERLTQRNQVLAKRLTGLGWSCE